MIFKRDIRVELLFPGKMSVYSIDDTLKKDNVLDLDWACAFVSSVVRSFHSYSRTGFCIRPPLENEAMYKEFLAAAQVIIKKGIKIIIIRIPIWNRE